MTAEGMRNNNPLNLRYVPGQPFGATRGEGGFAHFPTLEDGVAGCYHQLLLDWVRGHKTPTELIYIWAPPHENDSEQYVENVGAWSGLHMGSDIDLTDEPQGVLLVTAMWREECGEETVDPPIAKAGVEKMLALWKGEK